MNSGFEKFNQFLRYYVETGNQKIVLNLISYLKEEGISFPINDCFNRGILEIFCDTSDHSTLVDHNIKARGIIKVLDYLKHNQDKLFIDFWVLTFFLEQSDLNSKECASVLFFVLEKNLQAKSPDSDNFLFDDIQANRLDPKNITSDMFYNYFLSGLDDFWEDNAVFNLMSIDEVKRGCPELVDPTLISSFDGFIKVFCDSCIEIKRHYFDKWDSFDLEDIEKVIFAFEEICDSTKVLGGVKNILKKELSKREKKVKTMSVCLAGEQRKSQLLNDKEYKKLRKELESYYRIYQNEFVRDINYSDMIYCLSLMYQLGIDEANIDQFLLKYRLNCTSSIKDPIKWFIFFYEKLLYHQKDVRVMTSFQQLLEYMSDIFVVGDEEYSYVKEEMQKEQNKIEHLLIDNYDYEKNYVKKLLKVRKDYE